MCKNICVKKVSVKNISVKKWGPGVMGLVFEKKQKSHYAGKISWYQKMFQ